MFDTLQMGWCLVAAKSAIAPPVPAVYQGERFHFQLIRLDAKKMPGPVMVTWPFRPR
jgi:hypothetical protein